MTTIDDIHSELSPELKKLNDLISRRLKSSNELMDRVITGFLKNKGKQIRPILVILTAKLFGKVNDVTVAAAASVEMLHNASLIHDDVIDESKVRRGAATINSVWDNHIAVLIGDFFTSTSLAVAAGTGDGRLVESLARLGRLLSIGELDQIYNAQSRRLEESAYFEVISRKTASLFVTCVEMGAHSVGAAEDDIKAMCRFAELLGLCFQIRDDIFDYFDSKEIGKPTGNDLREGKITLPLLSVLLRADAPDHDAMLQLSRKEQLSDDEIATLMKYARDNGGIDYSYEYMRRLRDQAMLLLDTFPPCRARTLLGELFDFIIERKY